MAKVEKIAELLGVEVNENFTVINEYGEVVFHKAYIGTTGLAVNGARQDEALGMLLHGLYKIIKLPWVPKNHEYYYLVDITGIEDRHRGDCNSWDEDQDKFNKHALKNKMVCKTKEEAIERANKILELWKDYCEKNNVV